MGFDAFILSPFTYLVRVNSIYTAAILNFQHNMWDCTYSFTRETQNDKCKE